MRRFLKYVWSHLNTEVTIMRFVVIVTLAAVISVASGCQNMYDNIKTKSYNLGANGIAGKLTTVIDPTTGMPSPAITIGEADANIMSHLPGDGTMAVFTSNTSMWSSKVASKSVRISAKSGFSEFSMEDTAEGSTKFAFKEWDANIETDMIKASAPGGSNAAETVKGFRAALLKAIAKNTPEDNARLLSMLERETAMFAADPALKPKLDYLAAISDTALDEIKPGTSVVENRLVGNETLKRILTPKK